MTASKKLWIVVGVLILLSPLGILIPSWLGAGGAWGEWSVEEIKKLAGYAPAGMEKLSRLWKSPLRNYAVPGQGGGLARGSIGYIIAAVIGVLLTAGVAYVLGKILSRKDRMH